MNLQTTPEPFHVLHIEMPAGIRSHYHPPMFVEPDSIRTQLETARSLRAKPLYALRIYPKPGHDWVIRTYLARGK